jgi:hypothetical protein
MRSGFGFCEEIAEGCLDDDIKLLERELSAKKQQQKSCKGLMPLEISTRLYASVEVYLKVFLGLQNLATIVITSSNYYPDSTHSSLQD